MKIKTPVVMEYDDVIARAREIDHLKLEIIEMHERRTIQAENVQGSEHARDALQKKFNQVATEYEYVKGMITDHSGTSFGIWYDTMREKERFKSAPPRK